MPGALICPADYPERVALAGPCPTLDQFQPAGIDRMVERGALVGARPALLQHREGYRQRHRNTARSTERCGVGEGVLLLFAHRLRREPPCPLAGLAVVKRDQLAMLQHLLLDPAALGVVG